MYRSSYEAISDFLNRVFPSITDIYLHSLPAGHIRPSFFVQLTKGASEDVNRDIYHNKIVWQLVYCSPQDQDGNMDPLDQMQITEQLLQNLMNATTLTAPDGTQYQILSLEVENRDQELHVALSLGILLTRPAAQYDLMQTIENHYKEG